MENKYIKLAEKLFPPRVIKTIRNNFTTTLSDSVKEGYLSSLINNNCLYICGERGIGKTTMACYFTIELIEYNYKNKLPYLNTVFIPTVDLLSEIRDSYNKKTSEKDIVDKYKLVDLLILDDLGVEKATEWVNSILYLIINYRYLYLKPVIFTSNYSYGDLYKYLDGRIVSRIEEMSTEYKMRGGSLRKKHE